MSGERRKAPRPEPLQEGLSVFRRFFRTRSSWLANVRERNYGMKMGEVRLPGATAYTPNEPALIRRVLIDERVSFPKDRRYWSLLDPLMGNSILNSDGEVWKRQRAMIDPAFGQARMKVVFPLMRDAVGGMVERFAAKADSPGVIEIDSETTHVTADVILRALLSLPLSSDDARRIYEAFLAFTETLPALTNLALARVPRWLGLFFGVRRGRRAAKRIRALLEARIRPRFDAHRAGQPGEHQDILAGLLEAKDEAGQGFSFPEVVDHVAMLFLAGHETSASALAWALYLIAIHPEAQQRMADEIAAEVGGRELEFADLKRLRFTLDVFRETLRLYPPVGFLPRECAVEATMRGKVMAKGSPVLVSPYLIQRHRDLWKNPDDFDPDRFRTETEAVAQAYLPFGAGPRVCIGQAFALQEAVLVLASLVRRFRLAPAPGPEPVPVGRLTIRSERPILLALSRRDGGATVGP
jgi:cytochrome P450